MLAATLPAIAPAAPLSLELPTLDGRRFVGLGDAGGRPVLINFWASDCPECLAEWPVLQSIPANAVVRLGVAMDQRLPALQRSQRLGSAFPQAYAPADAQALLSRFGNRRGVLPYTVVLDDRHELCANHVGAVDAAWLRDAITRCGGHPR